MAGPSDSVTSKTVTSTGEVDSLAAKHKATSTVAQNSTQDSQNASHSPYLPVAESTHAASVASTNVAAMPQFQSALSYTTVRDFAYPDFHPLHYGVPIFESNSETEEDYYDDNDGYVRDGPPWQEDDDLASPVVKSHEVGDRISREYEFSVSSADEVHGRAIALFDFQPENENEAPLREGQIIWVSYRHGQGWLVAEVDPETGETGLVPEEYVEMIPAEEARRIQEERSRAEQAENSAEDELVEGKIGSEKTDPDAEEVEDEHVKQNEQ